MTDQRRLWLDPGFGASGDMILGALVGLGAPLDAIEADLARLDVDGWSLERSEVSRAGIAASRVEVSVADEPHHHRAWSTIDGLIADAGLPARVADGARATFRALGEVEAAIHQVAIDEVHFHEVGAVDAIVDVVGAWAALASLDVVHVTAGPVGLGSGATVATAHGQLGVPAPATLALLEGLPVKGLDTPAETVTPTGAALLATMVDSWGPIPDGRLVTSARGAGGRNPSGHPNVLTGLLLDADPADGTASSHGVSTPALVIATNVDDVTGEVLGHAIDRLLSAGADDAWLVPIGMKKNRPGNELRVLCRPDLLDDLQRIVFAETGTLGLRVESVVKRALDRSTIEVSVDGQSIAIKVGPHGAKPEHDDLVVASGATGRPIRELAQAALRAFSDNST